MRRTFLFILIYLFISSVSFSTRHVKMKNIAELKTVLSAGLPGFFKDDYILCIGRCCLLKIQNFSTTIPAAIRAFILDQRVIYENYPLYRKTFEEK